jgi:hypothetical protein
MTTWNIGGGLVFVALGFRAAEPWDLDAMLRSARASRREIGTGRI